MFTARPIHIALDWDQLNKEVEAAAKISARYNYYYLLGESKMSSKFKVGDKVETLDGTIKGKVTYISSIGTVEIDTRYVYHQDHVRLQPEPIKYKFNVGDRVTHSSVEFGKLPGTIVAQNGLNFEGEPQYHIKWDEKIVYDVKANWWERYLSHAPLTLTFGEAISEAKNGERIARLGWNGKGMWVCYMPAFVLPADKVNERTKKFVPSGDLNVGAYFVMMTAQGVWQPGWLASQADMDADDWQVVA